MNVVKIATAGSVDDGKSTLIGRLLYDTHSLTEDKLEAIAYSSRKKGYDYLDFSLATDGLVAEREQGITIDVAHIYFSTQNRSYIIADTPGHVEYTRNMVTGASTSEVAIILIDARKGVVEQTYRHFFINNLLRIKDVIVAINKMDLVDFSEQVFKDIKLEFEELNKRSTYDEQQLHFIPVSALHGDNIAAQSERMPWYGGESLLEHLEQLEVSDIKDKGAVRFPVQQVIRPKTADFHDFRGFAGKVYGGSLSIGDEVTVLPSGNQSRIKSIHFFDSTYEQAMPGNSVTLTLEDEINISRGDMLVKTGQLPKLERNLEATICWMDTKPLLPGTKYILQHNTNKVLSRIEAVQNTIATDYSGSQTAQQLRLNEIGDTSLKLSRPIYFDPYYENKTNGAFILIDPQTNTTSGVGFIN